MNIFYIIYVVVAIAVVAAFFVAEKRASAEAARYYPRHPNLDRARHSGREPRSMPPSPTRTNGAQAEGLAHSGLVESCIVESMA